MMSYSYLDTPVGVLLLAANEDGLREITFSKHPRVPPKSDWQEAPAGFSEAIRQLRAYFAGELEEFRIRLAPQGTEFQQRVWTELSRIPYGQTVSYGELARRIGSPNACRAVGLANGSNPIPIIIPCHRVIGANGKLTGYGGGLPVKEKLLALEKGQLRLLSF
jgi:methylated-DNA-[protein]-cysteine S-methyltransferase